MEENTNLSQNTAELPSAVDSGNAQEIAEAGLMDYANKVVAEEMMPQAEVANKEEETQQPEEASTEQEELVEEPAGDDNVEVEEPTNTEEVDPEVDSEKLALSFTDFTDQVGEIEIGGKNYTPAQLKSILGQEEAAGTKARKASEELAKVEAAKKELEDKENWLKRRTESVTQSDELAKLANQYNSLNAQYQKALNEENSHQMAILDGKMKNVANKYSVAQQQVQQVQKEAEQRHIASQTAILESKGFKDIVNEGYIKYVQDNISEAGRQAVNYDATLAIALEKARKYDELNSKKGKILKPTGKTLKSSGNTIKNNKTKREDAKQERIAQGRPTANDEQDFFVSLAKQKLKI